MPCPCVYYGLGSFALLITAVALMPFLFEEERSLILKANLISKKDASRIRQIAKEYFALQGYAVNFCESD